MKSFVKIFILFACISLFACQKDQVQQKFNVGIEILSLTCFPKDSIQLKFRIISTDGTPPYSYSWINPSSLQGEGPFVLNIIENTSFDVIVSDSNNVNEKFHYEILKDTIAPLNHDYRNSFTGRYKGTYSDTWKPMQSQYPVTHIYSGYEMSVTKHKDFNMLKIGVWDCSFNIKDLTFSGPYKSIGGQFDRDRMVFYDNTIDLIYFQGQKIKE